MKPRRFFSFLILFIFVFGSCLADPAVVYFDPGMTHIPEGVDRYPTEQEEWRFDICLSPFYQHASGARNDLGRKVQIGDRLGHWEMFGIIWGAESGVPAGKTLQADYPYLYKVVEDSKWANLSTDESFSSKWDFDGDYSVPVTYEKLGVRFNLDAALASGFGITIKSGIVDYKQTGSFNTTIRESAGDLTKTFLQDTLMTQSTREEMIEKDLCISLKPYETIAFEDTFVQVYWSNPFELRGKKCDNFVIVSPYVGAGVWIPTGKKKDPNKAFSLPTGHDGFLGISLEGALNFDFPDTVLINIGGSITFFETKKLKGQRVPNHKYQAGIYPWKADIRRRYGTGWNFNFSFMGRDIIDCLTVYFDYLYSKHERDTITMAECDSERNKIFLPCMLEEDSLWRSQMFQLGFDYQITPNLTFGVAGQTHISGVRVYKTHTVLGTVKFTF